MSILPTAVIALASLGPVLVAGQVPEPAANAWTLPRTPDGQPDLQGVWDFATVTPWERPPELADKEFLTDEDLAALEKRVGERLAERDQPIEADKGNLVAYNSFWFAGCADVGPLSATRPCATGFGGAVKTRRTSLVVDPPDGRIPPLTPEAQKRLAEEEERTRGAGPSEPAPGGWLEDFRLRDQIVLRCILGHNSGPPLNPGGGYNLNVQIFQTADHVVFFNEVIHSARIVPLDARPHLGRHMQQWKGDSRGRWEGDTLVVDTTNFVGPTSFQDGKTDANLHLVERFTRIDAHTLLYEFTVDDPTVWTKPWSAQIPIEKKDWRIYEAACHEGNHSLVNVLENLRFREQQSAEATKRKQED